MSVPDTSPVTPTWLANGLNLAKLLLALGHAPPEFTSVGLPFLSWVLEHGLAPLLKRYQAHWHLPVTGTLDVATSTHLTLPRCGHPDVLPPRVGAFGAAGPDRWAATALTYHAELRYDGSPDAEVASDYRQALDSISAVCPVRFTPAVGADGADIQAVNQPLDGPWNVLALSELPPPGAVPGRFTAHQQFDSAETGLTRPLRVAMFAHELGHALGLGHALPGSGCLMEPILSPSVTTPQPGDVAELARRYPAAVPPGTDPGPAPAPGPAPTSVTLPDITLGLDDGRAYAIRVTVRVTPAP